MHCKDTFIQYAKSQIKRAFGLNKKVFKPKEKEPEVLEFCFIWDGKIAENVKSFLAKKEINQKNVAISAIDKMENTAILIKI